MKPTPKPTRAFKQRAPASLRLYRLPARFLDGDWCVYDGTANQVCDYENFCEVLAKHGIRLAEGDVDAFVAALKPAKARSWREKTRSDDGFRVHVAWDPVDRHGIVWIKSYVTSDADVMFTMENVAFEKLVKQAAEAAGDSVDASGG